MTDLKLTDVSYLEQGKQGIPLLVKDESEFSNWLEAQSNAVQNWLATSGYKGKGLSLLPDSEGNVGKAIYFTDSKDHFCCGDLAGGLPATDFYLEEISAGLQDKVLLGWLVGCYKFTLFKTKSSDKPTENLLPTLYIESTEQIEKSKNLMSIEISSEPDFHLI